MLNSYGMYQGGRMSKIILLISFLFLSQFAFGATQVIECTSQNDRVQIDLKFNDGWVRSAKVKYSGPRLTLNLPANEEIGNDAYVFSDFSDSSYLAVVGSTRDKNDITYSYRIAIHKSVLGDFAKRGSFKVYFKSYQKANISNLSPFNTFQKLRSSGNLSKHPARELFDWGDSCWSYFSEI